MFEGFIRGVIRWKLFDGETTDAIMGFFPLNAMFNVLKEPFSRLSAVQSVANQIGEKVSLNYQTTLLEMAIVIIWTAVFVWGSYAIVKNRDL
jgi:hypothetical protein